MKDFIKRHGLPWNSRLGAINEIADMESYFNKRALTESPILMKLGEGPHHGPGVTIQLIQGTPTQYSRELNVRLTSPHLYTEGWRTYFPEYPGSSQLVEQKGSPLPPRLKSGTGDVSFHFYDSAEQVSFFWGPPGSELCFFRFDGVVARFRKEPPETYYAALDLSLGDWIPPYVRGLSKEFWQDKKHRTPPLF